MWRISGTTSGVCLTTNVGECMFYIFSISLYICHVIVIARKKNHRKVPVTPWGGMGYATQENLLF